MPFKRYYRVSKYARQYLQQPMRATREAGTGNNGGFNGLPDCITNFKMATIGFNQGDIVGQFTITYYLTFTQRTRIEA